MKQKFHVTIDAPNMRSEKFLEFAKKLQKQLKKTFKGDKFLITPANVRLNVIPKQ